MIQHSLLVRLAPAYPEFTKLFEAAIEDVAADPGYRAGQALFNIAYSMYGDAARTAAKRIDCDPFISNDNIFSFLDNLLEILTAPKR